MGEKLITFNFGTGTHGFAADDDEGGPAVAVCLLPGTELAFAEPARMRGHFSIREYTIAIFRQINKDQPNCHHDCLEFHDGVRWLLTMLDVGQRATVLQLPAEPKTEAEAEEQRRVEVVA